MNCCMVLFLALLGPTAALRSASSTSKSPISRIVSLLNGLKSKLEEDLKAETELYEKYKCWYKTTVDTKTASNAAADSRIESLKAYIADIEAGKIEFTTERQDLEKQIAELNKDLETAKTMRESENKDFVAAETEMKQGIAALDEAIKKIEGGTAGTFAQTRSYAALLAQRHSIQKSMAFARGFLSVAEQKYLEHVLSDEEPKDWKKLNRKATYKQKYQASSGKILSTLKKLKAQFEKNLDEAQKQEAEAQATYEKLKGSKEDMLGKAEQALTDMAEEGAARGLSKTEAQNEVDALTDQKEADTKFIDEAETAFKTKEEEWKAREEMRNKEILAMSQAIAVLADDDAKDQFTKSFKSQGYLFLQELSTSSRRVKCAARLVHTIASKSRDPRLSLLEVKAGTSNEAIDKVVEKIDEIVTELEAEEETDLENKQTCESDLADAASKARAAALEIDTATEDIDRAKSQIEELVAQIKEQEEKKKGLEEQVKDIKRQREDEKTKFEADKLDDEKAIALVEQALTIVKEWKSGGGGDLTLLSQHGKVVPKASAPVPPEGIMPPGWHPPAKVGNAVQPAHRLAAAAIKVHTSQKASSKQNPEYQVEAGEAPPPPPATWETGATYEGASGETQGIVGILSLVMDDMKADIKSAEADEEQAIKDYEKAKTDLEDEIDACDKAVTAYTDDKADKEKTVADKSEERTTKKTELDSQTDLYKGNKPGCDFLLINFDVRAKARTQEIDGLKKAKAILQGADFGDSLLQC